MILKYWPFYEEDIQKCPLLVNHFEFFSSKAKDYHDIKQSYIECLLKDYKGKHLKIVWDIGNRAADTVINPLLTAQREYIFSYLKKCMTLLHYHPDPTPLLSFH